MFSGSLFGAGQSWTGGCGVHVYLSLPPGRTVGVAYRIDLGGGLQYLEAPPRSLACSGLVVCIVCVFRLVLVWPVGALEVRVVPAVCCCTVIGRNRSLQVCTYVVLGSLGVQSVVRFW